MGRGVNEKGGRGDKSKLSSMKEVVNKNRRHPWNWKDVEMPGGKWGEWGKRKGKRDQVQSVPSVLLYGKTGAAKRGGGWKPKE